MQTRSPFFDELAKLMTTAAGAAQGAAREVETVVRAQLERLLGEFDLVSREEFEAVKAMAQAARTENEALKKRIAELEKASASRSPGTGAKPRAKASATAKPRARVKPASRLKQP